MRPQPVRRSWPSRAVLAPLVLAGCVAASPSATPSPSPSPDVDVGAAFLLAINAPDFAAKGDIEGSISIGLASGRVTGEFELVQADFRTLTTITIAGQAPVTTEQVSVAGSGYERTIAESQAGVWMASPPSGGSLFSVLSPAIVLGEAGTEERAGEILHRLVPVGPVDFEPTALGFTDPSIADFRADVAFLAEGDGTPAAMIVTADWRQTVGGSLGAASLELTFNFTSFGGPATVEAPDDVWLLRPNADYRYAMAHPTGWDVTPVGETAESAGYDLFLSPVAEEVLVYVYPDLTPDVVAAAWFRDSAALLEEGFGVPLETNEELTVGGLSARLFSLHGSDESGAFFHQEAVVFGSGIAWDLDWYSAPGAEVADRERFMQFLSTFRALG